jgi:hypothetical protein
MLDASEVPRASCSGEASHVRETADPPRRHHRFDEEET